MIIAHHDSTDNQPLYCLVLAPVAQQSRLADKQLRLKGSFVSTIYICEQLWFERVIPFSDLHNLPVKVVDKREQINESFTLRRLHCHHRIEGSINKDVLLIRPLCNLRDLYNVIHIVIGRFLLVD